MKQRNFFADLKSRNVYKMAVAYGVASLLLGPGGFNSLPCFRRATVGNESICRCQGDQ